jgi:hypothetical protein
LTKVWKVRVGDIKQPRGERPVQIWPIYQCSNARFRETELRCSDEIAVGMSSRRWHVPRMHRSGSSAEQTIRLSGANVGARQRQTFVKLDGIDGSEPEAVRRRAETRDYPSVPWSTWQRTFSKGAEINCFEPFVDAGHR